MTQTDNGETYLDAIEAMHRLHIGSRNTLKKLVDQGRLHEYKRGFGRKVWYKKSEIDALNEMGPVQDEE